MRSKLALIDRQYQNVNRAHCVALVVHGLIAVNFGWSSDPSGVVSKCQNVYGAPCYLRTRRIERRYHSVMLDWETREVIPHDRASFLREVRLRKYGDSVDARVVVRPTRSQVIASFDTTQD